MYRGGDESFGSEECGHRLLNSGGRFHPTVPHRNVSGTLCRGFRTKAAVFHGGPPRFVVFATWRRVLSFPTYLRCGTSAAAAAAETTNTQKMLDIELDQDVLESADAGPARAMRASRWVPWTVGRCNRHNQSKQYANRPSGWVASLANEIG